MVPMNSESRRPINERMIDRAIFRSGYKETPGRFRQTFANLRQSNPALYEQKRAEQRAAQATYQAQQPAVGQAAATLAQRLAQRKMRQLGGPVASYNPFA
jgi:hypothetical protein